jgi:hypothetical protein
VKPLLGYCGRWQSMSNHRAELKRSTLARRRRENQGMANPTKAGGPQKVASAPSR